MAGTVRIDREALLSIAAKAPADSSILMLNLLRFREQADYGDNHEFAPCSGRDAYYQRYTPVAAKLAFSDNVSIEAFGSSLGNIIAPKDERWDDVLLVRYPSFDAIRRLFDNPAYQAVVIHRTAALEDSRLFPFLPSSIPL